MKKQLGQYEALKTIYKVGHPISVIVILHEQIKTGNSEYLKIHVKTKNDVKGYFYLYNSIVEEEGSLLGIGKSLTAIIKNYNDEDHVLYLSTDSDDMEESTINSFKKFYSLIDNIKEGTMVTGTVVNVQPFGLFIDIGYDFLGLIDIGYSGFNKGSRLPNDNSKWPQKGDSINCIVSYYRFSNKQFGLGWIPEK